MNNITDITRQDIQDIIKDGFVEAYDEPVYDGETGEYVTERKVYMPFCGRLDEIAFFSRLYDLKSLPSHDSRYRDALGDISCHLRWGIMRRGGSSRIAGLICFIETVTNRCSVLSVRCYILLFESKNRHGSLIFFNRCLSLIALAIQYLQ